MKNPFNDFFHVPGSQELLDIAFKRAMKSSAQVSKNAPILVKAKKKESRRIKIAIEILIDRILKIIKSVPIIKDLPEFYQKLASLIVDTDKLKLTLGKLNGILPILSKLERESFKQLGKIEQPNEGDRIRRVAFGRVSSILRKQKENLLYLNQIRGGLRLIPSLDYTMPCIIFAGYPNVGKSSIVKMISTNKTLEVQSYPFTTKRLFIGHLEIDRKFDKIILQCMDTPGILDRPMSERNNIELQAILALRSVADLIFFIFDPSYACGYDIDSQIELFNEIRDNFTFEKKIEMLIVFNKKDLVKKRELDYIKDKLGLQDKDFFFTNALTGENLDEMIAYLKNRYN